MGVSLKTFLSNAPAAIDSSALRHSKPSEPALPKLQNMH